VIVDAHEDLAWNMLSFGRDYTRSVAETRRLEAGSAVVQHNGETLLGWPDWIEGDVGLVFAVLYVAPEWLREGAWETVTYDDPESAHAGYWRQLDVYEGLFDEHGDKFRRILSRADLDEHQRQWEDPDAPRRLGIILLMEGAEGIGQPDEVELWFERGVRILGMAWDRTRYAGSGYTAGPITSLGMELMERMAELGMILDISHLSEEASLQALDRYPSTVIATHANLRQFVPNTKYPLRQLSRSQVERLIEREGVVGMIPANKFIKDGWTRGDPRTEASLEDLVAQIDSVCQWAGNANHVGLGSDFDGGIGLDGVPPELNSVADLGKIGAALTRRGYAEDDMLGVLGGNWLRVLKSALPSS
jgi:membrane dipeptidase